MACRIEEAYNQLIIHSDADGLSAAGQISELNEAYLDYVAGMASRGDRRRALLGRYFAPAEDLPFLEGFCCAGQLPAEGGSALWVMFSDDDNLIYTPIMYDRSGAGTAGNTLSVFKEYSGILADAGLTLCDNCVRTWCYVEDIDDNYKDFYKTRTSYFADHGLTPETHYIASTGIAGTMPAGCGKVGLDALAVKNPVKADIKYLKGSSNLGRTDAYGVTFERGTTLMMDGLRTALISGTASIDTAGNVLHVGDIEAQTLRSWENVEVLLNEAGMSYDDVTVMIIYLRNREDAGAVHRLYDARFGDRIPKVFLHAPICRPAWLMETECVAVKR
ncbi:MAG: hypothetical protein IKX60_06380 [Bacteroidales bacterium]|nr:hypothetical protein [Bacteroidales bacterium]